jgi:hypothetical protein
MPGQVKFVVDAESAKAVDAFLRVVDAQKKTGDGSRDAARHGREHNAVLEKGAEITREFASGIQNLVLQFLSFEGIKKILEDMVEQMLKLNEARNKFYEGGGQRALSLPLYLNAPGGAAAFMQQSASISQGTGFDVNQVNQLRYLAGVRAAAGTDKTTIDQQVRSILSFAENTGEKPEAVLNITQDLRNAFNKMTEKQALGLVQAMRDMGGLPVDQQEGALQKALQMAPAIGLGPGDIGGIMGIAGHAGGDPSRTAQGLLMSLTKIPELLQQGLLKPDSSVQGYLQQLNTLQQTNPAAMAQITREVGPRISGAIAFAAQHPELFAAGQAGAEKYMTGEPTEQLTRTMEATPQIARMRQERRAGQGAELQRLNAPEALQNQAHDLEMMRQGINAFYNAPEQQGFRGAFGRQSYTIMANLGILDPTGPAGRDFINIGQAAAIDTAQIRAPIRGATTQPSSNDEAGDQIEAAGHLLISAAQKMPKRPRVMLRNPGGFTGPQ